MTAAVEVVESGCPKGLVKHDYRIAEGSRGWRANGGTLLLFHCAAHAGEEAGLEGKLCHEHEVAAGDGMDLFVESFSAADGACGWICEVDVDGNEGFMRAALVVLHVSIK